MLYQDLTDTVWVEVGTGLTFCAFQSHGPVRIYVGSVAPSNLSDVGFYFDGSDGPIVIPGLSDAGGGVWAKSVNTVGGITHATA